MLAAVLLLASPTPAQIRISADKPVVHTGEWLTFKVELKNVSRKPLEILDVGDGSESHWINPHIGWSVLRVGDGESHPKDTPQVHLVRCGNMNTTTATMFHTLKPGEAVSFPFAPIDFDFSKPGKYRVVFYYEVDPKDTPRLVSRPVASKDGTIAMDFGGLPESLLPKYRALTPLKIQSNEVLFVVQPTAP